MSLQSDFDEFRTTWSKSSLLFKLLAGAFFVSSMSSVASLSETFFEWKGFFSDAVVFYRSWVSLPLSEAISRHFHVTFDSSEVDLLTTFCLVMSSPLRDVWLRVGGRSSDFITLAAMIAVTFVGLVWASAVSEDSADFIPAIVGMFSLWLIMGVLNYRKINRLAYFGPVALVITIVSLLAAVSAGLSR